MSPKSFESFAAQKSDVPTLIAEIGEGRPIVLVDDEDRENEGDIVIAAQMATPSQIAFMAQNACGLICLAMTARQAGQIGLDVLPQRHASRLETAFTVSIEGRSDAISTGISAADRARTIAAAISPEATPASITSPGHVFPIIARDGGTLVRSGHTEASVDLARLAGLNPAAVICEIMKPDGKMARRDELVEFARKFDLKIGTIADLIAWRLAQETLVECVHTSKLLLGDTPFELKVFRDSVISHEHLALCVAPPAHTDQPPLVRVHRLNTHTDVLATAFGMQGKLGAALRKVANAHGAVVIVNATKLPSMRSYTARGGAGAAEGEAESDSIRSYGIGAQILRQLGMQRIQLLSDTPRVLVGLEGHGITLAGHTPLTG